MGEETEIFNLPIPPLLAGKTLAESGIGRTTGLVVLAITVGEETDADLFPSKVLPDEGRLTVLGTAQQLMAFKRNYR